MADNSTERSPHSFWYFWSKALWNGAKESWETGFGRTLEVAAILLPIGIIALRLYHTHHSTFDLFSVEDNMNLWIALIPPLVGLAWFLSHVFRQPYKIYKEQFESHQSELKEIESFHQKMIDKASESLAERRRKIDELEKNLARGSVGDRLVLNKIKSKESLGFYLADLRFRINTVKQINEFNYGGDIQEKVEEESKRILLRGSQLLYQNLTSSEAEFFNEAKAQPLPEPNQWSPQIHQANNLKRHINMLQSKYNELKRIIDKI